MPAIPGTQIAKVVTSLTNAGNRLSIGLHYATTSVIPGHDLASLCNEFETNMLPVLLACLSSEIKVQSIEAHCVEAQFCNPGCNYLSGKVGTISGESLPSNVGAVLQLRQVEISSRHNGHVTIPGVPESECVDNLLTVAYAGGPLAIMAVALVQPLTTPLRTYDLCVLQRLEAGVKITPVGWKVHDVRPVRNMGTQRRRTTELREFHP